MIDPATADFHEPHIRQQFERLIKDFAILAILTETMKRDELLNQLSRIVPFNVLRAPLETVEIQYRLQAAFAFAESRAELFFETVAAGTGAGLLVVDASEKSREAVICRHVRNRSTFLPQIWGREEKPPYCRSRMMKGEALPVKVRVSVCMARVQATYSRFLSMSVE